MKFFHIADLHFGKTLFNLTLTETDQRDWVQQFLTAVDKHQPDAVVIAGDVYDRRIPTQEAMQLFDYLLTELAKRDKYVFVIPGNHDSAIRLSHVNELLKTNKIYIAGILQRELTHITVNSEACDVTFWLMPYIFPKLVMDEQVLDLTLSMTYDEAARALLRAQPVDESACNVLIAHQNVLADGIPPEHSDSETIIGGLGEIDYSAFKAFDYVALGHIHNAQKVGRETVRYAGCPIYYDFSELRRDKSLTLVTVHSKEDICVERVEIPLLHRLMQKTGTLEELLQEGAALEHKENIYVQCILCDKQIPPRALEQLRAVYGDCLVNVRRSLPELSADPTADWQEADGRSLSLEQQFAVFYQDQQNELIDGVQEHLIDMLLEQQTRQSGEFYDDYREIPATESDELLEYLMQTGTEAGT